MKWSVCRTHNVWRNAHRNVRITINEYADSCHFTTWFRFCFEWNDFWLLKRWAHENWHGKRRSFGKLSIFFCGHNYVSGNFRTRTWPKVGNTFSKHSLFGNGCWSPGRQYLIVWCKKGILIWFSSHECDWLIENEKWNWNGNNAHCVVGSSQFFPPSFFISFYNFTERMIPSQQIVDFYLPIKYHHQISSEERLLTVH